MNFLLNVECFWLNFKIFLLYSGGHKSESTPIFLGHLEILSYLQNFYELKHAH